MIKIIIAFAVGAAFGAIMMSCCAAAGRADRDAEQYFNKENETDIS